MSLLLLHFLKICHHYFHHFLVALWVGGAGAEVGDLAPLGSDSLWGQALDVVLDSSGPLPSLLGNVSCSDLKKSSVFIARIMSQEGHERSNVVWGQSLDNLSWHDSGSHSSACKRGNAVASNVPLLALLSERLSESPKAEFGGGVVHLSEGSIDSSARPGVDDSTILLFSHDVPSSSGHRVSSLEMNLHDEVPVQFAHFLE